MTVLEQISHETLVFMRGKYCLDEIGMTTASTVTK